MKLSLLILQLATLSCVYSQQALELCSLEDSINETSGLLFLNGTIISHNDSGDGPYLYEIDSISGNIVRTVFVQNAANTDWEDLTSDGSYIYIGDFGNNSGNRIDLKVYRLLITDFFTTPNDTVSVDTILFSYADQTDFTSSPFNTNFDAEAFISISDSLYIFTKNWIDSKTNIYCMSKITGVQSAIKVNSIDSQGLVAGADFDSISGQIILSGYATVNPFIITISQFTVPQFSSGNLSRSDIQLNGSSQLEGICSISKNEHYLSTEINFTGAATLHRLSFIGFSNLPGTDEHHIYVYPNPARTELYINSEQQDYIIEVYDLRGFLIKSGQGNKIDISNIASGVHFIKLIDPRSQSVITEKIIIN